MTARQGSDSYMAPEIHESQVYDGRKVDLFAVGCTLLSIVTGKQPFHKTDSSDKYWSLLANGQLDQYFKVIQPPNEPDLSLTFKDLIVGLLYPETSQRYTIDFIAGHPWIQKSFDSEKVRIDLLKRH